MWKPGSSKLASFRTRGDAADRAWKCDPNRGDTRGDSLRSYSPHQPADDPVHGKHQGSDLRLDSFRVGRIAGDLFPYPWHAPFASSTKHNQFARRNVVVRQNESIQF